MENIKFDPKDIEGMRKLMDDLGDSNTLMAGKNSRGEDVNLSIFRDKIVATTYQSNRWARTNIYYRDGSTEEMFAGKY